MGQGQYFFDENWLHQVENLLNIGIALSAERNRDRLLQMIVYEACCITGADAGTLYLCEDDCLRFKILYNASMGVNLGGKGEPVELPPVPLTPQTVSGYVALTGKAVNIEDVYKAGGFDFSGPRDYDRVTGYRTQSMLVVPMRNHEGKVIGVLQLINAIDPESGQVIPFASHFQKVVESLASQAAVALTNFQLLEDIEKLFKSFVEVMATVIDARTPYNAHHTRRVAQMAEALAVAINQVSEGACGEVYFDEERLNRLVMAAWLHDIGKIVVPLAIMDKPTRLGERLPLVLQRLDYIKAAIEAHSLKVQLVHWQKGRAAAAEEEKRRCQAQLQELEEARGFILYLNNPGVRVTEADAERLKELGRKTLRIAPGKDLPWLLPEELEALSVRTGTLTVTERRVMEEHAAMTLRLLEKMPFAGRYQGIPFLASAHHEFLDGSGYPYGLKGDDVPIEARILALADIFDALTAHDRPYREGMAAEEAIRILENMAREGKIDSELLRIFIAFRVWEAAERKTGES